MERTTHPTSPPRPLTDPRPLAAVGHVSLSARDAAGAARRLELVGLRLLLVRAGFAILELRGGTHAVLREAPGGPHAAPFDLMYEDLDAARALFVDAGFEASPIERGGIHDGFAVTAPEGFTIRVTSSHAGRRAV